MVRKRSTIVARFLEKQQLPGARERNHDRLVRSIASTLRVEGYELTENEVRRALEVVKAPARS